MEEDDAAGLLDAGVPGGEGDRLERARGRGGRRGRGEGGGIAGVRHGRRGSEA